MGIVGRLDQYASMLAAEFDETTANNASISGFGTYYASEFNENIVDVAQGDHGFASWYCLVTGTATYSIVNSSGGFIYENNGGTITTLVTATAPQRGTISVTAGRTYYGSVPINLVVEDQQHSIAPLTMVGTEFWHIAGRVSVPPTAIYTPTIYYIHSPYNTATVNFYDGSSAGLVGIATSTITINAGGIGTFTSSTETNHWISSNVPVLASVTRNGADKTILSPMSNYVYQRFIQFNNTTNSTTPTNNNTNVTYDSNYKVMNMTIADGSGGDAAQGLGLEYLSNAYSWGNVLSDYVIVAPYDGTIVTTSYWSGSAWVVWDTHSLSGTITSPAYVARDGTTGVGIAATIINGTAANMASGATLWKWEGNQRFYLCINDSVDDEFSVLGWIQEKTVIIPANIFPPYDPVYDEFGGTLFGSGQGRYMRQNTDKSVIVYNEIDEISDFRDIVRNGLVLDLDAGMNASFDNTGTTWNDLSGNGYDATIVGTSVWDSTYGGQFAFGDVGQTSQYIILPHQAAQSTGTSFTLEFWMRPISSGTHYFCSMASAVTDNYFLLTQPPTYINRFGSTTPGVITYSSNEVFQFCIVGNNSGTGTMYKNGGNATSTDNVFSINGVANGGWILNQEQDSIGGGFDPNQNYRGAFMSVRLYNRVLTAAEIAQNYNALKHRFGL